MNLNQLYKKLNQQEKIINQQESILQTITELGRSNTKLPALFIAKRKAALKDLKTAATNARDTNAYILLLMQSKGVSLAKLENQKNIAYASALYLDNVNRLR